MSTPDPTGPAGPPTRPSVPHRPDWLAALGRRRWIAALLALVLVAAAGIAVFSLNRAGRDAAPAATQTQSPSETPTPTPTPSESPPPAPAPPPPPQPIPDLPAGEMNVLVIGSDSRGIARNEAAHTAETGEPSDQRSDSLMLVHVPADRHTLYVISIMRDLWVDVPGVGGSKINAALEYGGIDLTTQTVQQLLGVTIDHTLMLDFNGFRALTDGLGGIDVNVPFAFQSTIETQHVFSQGINHLDGQAALEFSRERYAFTDGDFQRVQNQRTMLRAILARLTGGGALNDVNAVRSLVDFAGCCLTVDKGFDPVQAAILAYSLRNLDVNAIGTMTLPTAGTGMAAGQSVVFPDYGGIAAVGAALREGRIADFAVP
ncbi:LytR family transcriptional regulator [Pseudarthrobacter sp. AG30]|uniref:LCP family protein n=1 Tax=Pseudarthrobacter sp. AG30 TaxID=2249742 RepID=UPI000D64C8F5|nr:LCP family protein [Pseudarthrobacter sp. AG30]RAX16917.1 LytR family transcriptional regulator [Pseudarthrobacter sp. AG30]